MNQATRDATDWTRAMIANHIQRFPRSDWPRAKEAGSFFAGWSKAFASRNVTQAEAEGASIQLMEDPPEHIDRHLAALLRIIEGRRERAAFDQSQGRYAPTPKYEPSDPGAVALFRRFCEAKGEEQVAILRELSRRAATEVDNRPRVNTAK